MVDNALKTMELVYVELDAGDALIFHSNLLHRSEANLSDRPRWSIISCYNLQSNLAYNRNLHRLESAGRLFQYPITPSWIGKLHRCLTADFLKKENDPALKETGWEK